MFLCLKTLLRSCARRSPPTCALRDPARVCSEKYVSNETFTNNEDVCQDAEWRLENHTRCKNVGRCVQRETTDYELGWYQHGTAGFAALWLVRKMGVD